MKKTKQKKIVYLKISKNILNWGQKIISDHVSKHYNLLVVSKRPIFMLEKYELL